MKMYCFIKGCDNINKSKLKFIITLILGLSILVTGYCSAKYEITKIITADANIAVPVLEIEGTESTKISNINNIGYYDFNVKNYNETNISDVPQNYTIEIISNTDDSINFELYEGDEEIQLNNNKTEKIDIKAIEKEEHSYRLKVSYDKEKNKDENDILEDIQIKVHSEQSKI